MLVHRLDTVLARTDPFDLAQALDRHIGAMSADRIRSVVIDARERIGEYYRAEMLSLLEENRAVDRVDWNSLDSEKFVQIVREAHGDEALQRSFARLLKSNLRAIPLFGATFTQAVLQNVPSDRAFAFGEEQPKTPMRIAVFGGIAVALLLLGAAGEQVIANVRAQNVVASPLPRLPAPVANVPATQPPARDRVVQHTNRVAAVAPATPVPTIAPAASVPSPAVSVPPPVAAPAASQHTVVPKKHTPPPAQGVATIAIPQPTPTPQPSDLDVTDMPDVFTDATPLPSQSPATAEVPSRVMLKTPTPAPKKGWVKRTISHLDPFKPIHP